MLQAQFCSWHAQAVYVEPLARQAVGLDGRVQKILTWRWKEVPVELGRQAVTCGQGEEGKDDNSIEPHCSIGCPWITCSWFWCNRRINTYIIQDVSDSLSADEGLCGQSVLNNIDPSVTWESVWKLPLQVIQGGKDDLIPFKWHLFVNLVLNNAALSPCCSFAYRSRRWHRTCECLHI